MHLQSLLQGTELTMMSGSMAQDIQGIAHHTNQVRPGWVFVAIPGAKTDGHAYVPAAVAAGAVAVITGRPVAVPDGVTNVVVGNPRQALATMAAQWFQEPSREIRLVGVTGTNGKTTITYLLESLWRAARRRPGVIGTVGIRYGTVSHPAGTTTPESLDLQHLLRTMCDANVQDVAMEVSSHALTQDRVTGCHFDGAIFTNLTQDHLDYHGDMATYAATKRRLFHDILAVSCKLHPWVVVNADDPASQEMVHGCMARIIWYSVNGVEHNDIERRPTTNDWVYAEDCHCTVNGIRMHVVTPMGRYALASQLRGRFNASNLLAAAAAAFAMGLPVFAVQTGVAALRSVPGRLEAVENPAGITILVDYAHTPDALRNVLAALRDILSTHAERACRIITVFGCGGDRDPGKRPLMGAEVGRGSDVAIVTSDNPRTEDPAAIIAQIVPGLRACGWRALSDLTRPKIYQVIPDRKNAIEAALQMARPGDIVLVAGKGHEDYQMIGTEKRHFDDRHVVRTFYGIDG